MPSSDIERSGFFNAQLSDGTYDREYEAEDFSKYFELFFGDGVFVSPADQLMVKASSGLTISVKAGNAFIRGHYYELLEDTTMAISASSSPRRVDVCLELNMTDRTITRQLLVTQGSGNSIPALSAPTNTGNVRQLKLATIPIPAGTSTITNSMITDLRPNEVYCGYVKGAIESIETGDLFQQFTDVFKTWFNDIKGQLAGDVAGNLQNQIANLKNGAYMLTLEEKITASTDLNTIVTPGNYYCNNPSVVSNCPTARSFVLKVESIVNTSSSESLKEGVRQTIILPEGIEITRNSLFDDGSSTQKRWSVWYSNFYYWAIQAPVGLNIGNSNRFEYTKNTLGLKALKDGDIRYVVTDAMYYYGSSQNLYKFDDGSDPNGVSIASIENNLNSIFVKYNRNGSGAPSNIRPVLKIEIAVGL